MGFWSEINPKPECLRFPDTENEYSFATVSGGDYVCAVKLQCFVLHAHITALQLEFYGDFPLVLGGTPSQTGKGHGGFG